MSQSDRDQWHIFKKLGNRRTRFMINVIFSQFVEATPITVMVRGIMERIFEPTALNELFETHASPAIHQRINV